MREDCDSSCETWGASVTWDSQPVTWDSQPERGPGRLAAAGREWRLGRPSGQTSELARDSEWATVSLSWRKLK